MPNSAFGCRMRRRPVRNQGPLQSGPPFFALMLGARFGFGPLTAALSLLIPYSGIGESIAEVDKQVDGDVRGRENEHGALNNRVIAVEN
jgi:hypothetical protein